MIKIHGEVTILIIATEYMVNYSASRQIKGVNIQTNQLYTKLSHKEHPQVSP